MATAVKARGGCPANITTIAPICSNQMGLERSRHLICPPRASCGENSEIEVTSEKQFLPADPALNPLSSQDVCSYNLTVENYRTGDAIVISEIMTSFTSIELFFGGIGITNLTDAVMLYSSNSYTIDASQQVYLTVRVTDDFPADSMLPYYKVRHEKLPH